MNHLIILTAGAWSEQFVDWIAARPDVIHRLLRYARQQPAHRRFASNATDAIRNVIEGDDKPTATVVTRPISDLDRASLDRWAQVHGDVRIVEASPELWASQAAEAAEDIRRANTVAMARVGDYPSAVAEGYAYDDLSAVRALWDRFVPPTPPVGAWAAEELRKHRAGV